MRCQHAIGGGQTNGPGGTDGLMRQGSQAVHHTEWHLGLSQAFEAELLEVIAPSAVSQPRYPCKQNCQGILTGHETAIIQVEGTISLAFSIDCFNTLKPSVM